MRLFQFAEDKKRQYDYLQVHTAIVVSTSPDTNYAVAVGSSHVDTLLDYRRVNFSAGAAVSSSTTQKYSLHQVPYLELSINSIHPMLVFVPIQPISYRTGIYARVGPSVPENVYIANRLLLSAIVSTWSPTAVTWNTKPPVVSVAAQRWYLHANGRGLYSTFATAATRYINHDMPYGAIRYLLTTWGVSAASMYGVMLSWSTTGVTGASAYNTTHIESVSTKLCVNFRDQWGFSNPFFSVITSTGSAALGSLP